MITQLFSCILVFPRILKFSLLLCSCASISGAHLEAVQTEIMFIVQSTQWLGSEYGGLS